VTGAGTDPVVGDAAAVRLMPGFSGAQVYLVTRDHRHWFVRKAAQNPAASARLRAQAAKQRLFSERMGHALRTPLILGEGEHEGRWYFDMELVRGVDGASHLRRASYAEVVAFGDRLCAYLGEAAAAPPLAPAAAASLFESSYAKVVSVQGRTQGLSPDTLARLFLALDRARGASEAPQTFCHGDLTLENIIVADDGSLCVVDLLDSPYEHYWQDAAKLQQDLAGGWYRRAQPAIAPCVLEFLSRRLVERATALDAAYPRVHFLLVALVFVRILPYTRTEAERAFVVERIDHFARRAAEVETASEDSR
jgi:aminoglycoside phosphotransferase (APT) family kinase protein